MMSEWTDGSLINEDVINSLTSDQLVRLAEMLKDIDQEQSKNNQFAKDERHDRNRTNKKLHGYTSL